MHIAKIGVLMGGMSIEKEVSLSSGRTICDHLDTNRYNAIPLFQSQNNKLYLLPWSFLYRGKIKDFEHRLHKEATLITWDDLKKYVDFIYIAQHGRYAEDGCLQGTLEVLNIPYLGSKILGSALGMNKSIQKKILQSHNITTPKSVTITSEQLSESIILKLLEENNLDYPLVIKPAQEGSSLGVRIALNKEQLISGIEYAMKIDPHSEQPVLIEEKIEGMEFTCVTLINPKTGNILALPPTELTLNQGSHILDFEHKYMPGYAQKFTPARCSEKDSLKIQETCLAVMNALHFSTISRIDGFLKKDGSIVIIDPNTLCGMAPSSFFFNQAAQLNMSHTEIINYLIESEFKNYNVTSSKNTKENMNISLNKKIRIGVLLGGNSNEKETSLNSGRNVCYKLSPEKYEVTPLFLDSKMDIYPLDQKLLVHNTTSEIEYDLDRSKKITWSSLPEKFDFIFIALHGGFGENGAVQGMLEMLKMPYNGSSVLASALAMNKYETNTFLKTEGFDVPKGILLKKNEWNINKNQKLKEIQNLISFPIIIKPHDDGCSVMVSKAKDESELSDAIELIFSNNKDYALIEECIIGMELTVGVIGNENKVQALPPSQAVASNGILSIEEKFLPGAGENQTPAPLSNDVLIFIKKIIEQVYIAVGCSGYARIDCFYQKAEESPTKNDRIVILEINSLPALTPATCLFHQAAEVGIKPMELIDKIVNLGIEKHRKNSYITKNQLQEFENI